MWSRVPVKESLLTGRGGVSQIRSKETKGVGLLVEREKIS